MIHSEQRKRLGTYTIIGGNSRDMNVERTSHMTPTRKKKTLMVKLTVAIQETFGIH